MLRLALLAALLLTTVACGTDDPPQHPSGSVRTTTIDPEVQIECSNVERAYNAWHWEPQTSADWSLGQVRYHLDNGEAFHDAITGYTDKPALDLVVAVAQYNYEMSLVQADMTIKGSADTAAAESARTDVVDAFEAFQRATCQ